MLACRVIRVCLWPCVLIIAVIAGAAQPPASPAPLSVQPDIGVRNSLIAFPCSTAVDSVRIGTGAGACRLRVFNFGAIGQGGESNLAGGCDPANPGHTLYEGSFILAADSIAAPSPDGGAVWRGDYRGLRKRFLPNPAPYGGGCGFNQWTDVLLGRIRTGGCPGTPADVSGDIVATSYSDTSLSAAPGSRQAAAGVDVIQTVVGAHDPLYGDFVLFRWVLHNRDAVAKGPWHAGSWIDWDVGDCNYNDGRFSDLFNGYFIWNPVAPTLAFGMFDPEQPSLYSTTDPTANSPYRIRVSSNVELIATGWCVEWICWGLDSPESDAWSWSMFTHEQPRRKVDNGPGYLEDKSGFLVNRPFSLTPNGSWAIHQALFWAEATSNDPAIVEANATDVARRAARWAGFARGDVNEDGFVDLADVCWLIAGLPIYPDTYCADVDANGTFDSADIRYLLSFISASGPGPRGAWRFQLPPEP